MFTLSLTSGVRAFRERMTPLSAAQLGDLLALVAQDTAAPRALAAAFRAKFPPPHLSRAALEALTALLALQSPLLPVCASHIFPACPPHCFHDSPAHA